jgi:hypothetical protein
MTTFPGSPRLLKGGIVLIDPEALAVRRIIALHYDFDSLARPHQLPTASNNGDRSKVLLVKGPLVNAIKLEADFDAADQPKSARLLAKQGLPPSLVRHGEFMGLDSELYEVVWGPRDELSNQKVFEGLGK